MPIDASSTELQGGRMNKLEIIDHIAKSADISKAAAGRSLDAAVTAIKTAMKKGNHAAFLHRGLDCGDGRVEGATRGGL